MPEPNIPLLAWRGLRYMTKKDVLCACKSCGHRYSLGPEFANTLARELGLGSRVERGGMRIQHAGNKMTPGFGQLAMTGSGLELDRQNRHLSEVMRLVACNRCGSPDVLLAKQ